jgi:hypothetical protein
MTDINKAIERVLELDNFRKEAKGPRDIFFANEASKEYRTLCPRLARALKIALEALEFYKQFKGGPVEDSLSQIAKVFE